MLFLISSLLFHLRITVHSFTCNITSVPCRNGRYKSPPPNSRMPIPVSVSSGKPYRNSSSNTIPSLPKKMGYSRAKVTFQRYYSDVKNLTTDNLQTFFEGNLWIITRRKKTNTESNIRLLNVPQKIKPPNYTQKLPLRCHLTTLKRNTDERKRNIITIDGYGKVAMPTDINTTAMTEVVLQDSCKLNSQMCNGYQ